MGFNVSGAGSGIDWQLYINSILQAESDKLARTLGRQEVKASATSTVFSNVQGVMRGLNAAVNDFKFSGDFKQMNVTSSKPELITASATLSAVPQPINVIVKELATLEKHSLSFSDVDDPVTSADATITINVRGEAHEIEVAAGTTLAQLRSQINSAGIGVTVAVFNAQDGSELPARLTIQDKKLGLLDENIEDGIDDNITFEISELTQVKNPFVKTVAAADTVVEVEGVEVRRDSHVINDVVPGVSFQVLKADENQTVTLTVTESTNGATEKIDNLVNRYNEVIGVLKQSLAFDPNLETQTNPTAGNSTLRNILTRIQSLFSSTVAELPEGSKVRSLTDLGVESSYDVGAGAGNGFLEFDKTKFKNALAENYDDVIQFFEGISDEAEKIDGFANKAGKLMDSFLNTTDGVLKTKIDALSAELKDIDEEKRKKLELLAAKEERLTIRFARLETQMARLNSQQSQLNAAVSSLNLNNQFISNRGGK